MKAHRGHGDYLGECFSGGDDSGDGGHDDDHGGADDDENPSDPGDAPGDNVDDPVDPPEVPSDNGDGSNGDSTDGDEPYVPYWCEPFVTDIDSDCDGIHDILGTPLF